jgi:prepilin-type N-terminal cleavage/methylation domain-containing protein
MDCQRSVCTDKILFKAYCADTQLITAGYSGKESFLPRRLQGWLYRPFKDGAISARFLRSNATVTCQGFSLVEVLITLTLLSMSSMLVSSYLRQIAVSDQQQWQLREGWRAAAQSLEENCEEAKGMVVERIEDMNGCFWQKTQVTSGLIPPPTLRQLICPMSTQTNG